MVLAIMTLIVVGVALVYVAKRIAGMSPIDGDDFTFMYPLTFGALAIFAAMATATAAFLR
jgi:hypothetical protein